ncbi:hypothetical protein [Streptomyces sp. NPDC003667]
MRRPDLDPDDPEWVYAIAEMRLRAHHVAEQEVAERIARADEPVWDRLGYIATMIVGLAITVLLGLAGAVWISVLAGLAACASGFLLRKSLRAGSGGRRSGTGFTAA